MKVPITVGMAVGPRKHHIAWIGEALDSILAQTQQPAELLIIDDMHGIAPFMQAWEAEKKPSFPVRVYEAPWHLGISNAINFMVSMSKTECIISFAADDVLGPKALEAASAAYDPTRPLDYYWYDVGYIDDVEPLQSIASGYALLTKQLWRRTGGLPIETASGHSDVAFVSRILVSGEEMGVRLQRIPTDTPQWFCRVHQQADHTSRSGQGWGTVIDLTRQILTHNWKPLDWGRIP